MIHLKYKNSMTLGEETNSLNSMSNEWNVKQWHIHSTKYNTIKWKTIKTVAIDSTANQNQSWF